MARVTDTDVKLIIDTDLTTTTFITTANLIVDEYLDGLGMSEDLLTQIELYLSAHLVSLRERQLTSEKFGDAADSYGGKFGLGLDFTQYGQTVKMLDTSGTFSNVGKVKARMDVIFSLPTD